MSRHSIFCVAFILAGAMLLSAQPTSFGIDVPNGKWDMWRIDDLGPVMGIDATLEITELRFGSQWQPVFTVVAEADDIGLGLRWETARGKPITSKLMAYRGKAPMVDQEMPEVPLKKNERFTLRLDWSQPGVMQVRLNSHTINPKMPFVPRSLSVSASSGEILCHRIALLGGAPGTERQQALQGPPSGLIADWRSRR